VALARPATQSSVVTLASTPVKTLSTTFSDNQAKLRTLELLQAKMEDPVASAMSNSNHQKERTKLSNFKAPCLMAEPCVWICPKAEAVVAAVASVVAIVAVAAVAVASAVVAAVAASVAAIVVVAVVAVASVAVAAEIVVVAVAAMAADAVVAAADIDLSCIITPGYSTSVVTTLANKHIIFT